jgi:trans-aconitate methyltransferase
VTSAFFQLHSDLPREGPGEPEDVIWAMERIRPSRTAHILDAGCGPGADIETLIAQVPDGRVTGVDLHAPFVDAVRNLCSDDPRIEARVVDMRDAGGLYDVIWCAGALYFLGGVQSLNLLHPLLKSGGAVAFSEPCYFVPDPSERATAFWEGEGASVLQIDAILNATQSAGYDVLGHRPLAPSAWDAYYTPMETRIAALRGTGSAALEAVLDDAEAEIAGWRAAKDETGYLLVAARQK